MPDTIIGFIRRAHDRFAWEKTLKSTRGRLLSLADRQSLASRRPLEVEQALPGAAGHAGGRSCTRI